MNLEQQQQPLSLLTELYKMDRDFEPTTYFDPSMDQLVYVRSNAPYRANRVDEWLTFYWAVDRMELIGVKIKGVRYLFNRLRDVGVISKQDFVPFCLMLEGIMKHMVNSKDGYQKVVYEQASDLVGDIKFDARQLLAA